MDKQEMIEKAALMRSRDRFGPMTEEELSMLPGKERLLSIPAGDRSVRVFEIRPERDLQLPAPLLINYHGGGFIKGRADRDKRYCCHMAQDLGCIVWDVDYCLAPEQPYPAALEESYGVAAYAFANAEKLGIDPARIILAGHSAGGNLVAAILVKLYETKEFAPSAVLMEYFPTNQTIDPADKLSEELRSDPFWIRRAATEKEYTLFYCTDEQAKEACCSPMLAEDAVLASFPECLIISASKDSLRQEVEDFAARLRSLGVPVSGCQIPGAVHGFTINRTEGWEKALKLHLEFFHKHFSK